MNFVSDSNTSRLNSHCLPPLSNSRVPLVLVSYEWIEITIRRDMMRGHQVLSIFQRYNYPAPKRDNRVVVLSTCPNDSKQCLCCRGRQRFHGLRLLFKTTNTTRINASHRLNNVDLLMVHLWGA